MESKFEEFYEEFGVTLMVDFHEERTASGHTREEIDSVFLREYGAGVKEYMLSGLQN